MYMSRMEHFTGLYTLGTCILAKDKIEKHHATKEERDKWLAKSYQNFADSEFDDENVEENMHILRGRVMIETLEILMNDGCLTEDEAIDLIEEEGMDDLLDED